MFKKISLVLIIIAALSFSVFAEINASDKVLHLHAEDMPLIVGDGTETLLNIEIRNFIPILQAFGLEETSVEFLENSAQCTLKNKFKLTSWDDNKVLKIVVLTYQGAVAVNANGLNTGGCTILIKATKTAEVLHTIDYKFLRN